MRWCVDVLDGQGITPDSGGSDVDHSVSSDSQGLDANDWHPAAT